MRASRYVFATATWLAVLLALASCRDAQSQAEARPPRNGSDSKQARTPAWFVDVGRQAGIDFTMGHDGRTPLNVMETLGCGCAFLDFDMDGQLDLFLVGQPESALFRNVGKGRFQRVKDSGVTRRANWMGCTVGDYDNDGDPDLLVTGYRDLALYRNDGGAAGTTFTEVTATSGLSTGDWTTSAGFADTDSDGLLDLYVASYVEFNRDSVQYCTFRGVKSACGPRFYDPQIGRLYRNLGGGRFQDITRPSGLRDAHGKGLGVVFSDYDDDGRIDLYVANDEVPADMFHNEGGGKFRNVAALSGTAYDHSGQVQGGMGVDFADYNADGRMDLVVGTFQNEADSLYRNDGNGHFVEMAAESGLGEPTLNLVAFGMGFFDFDHDRRLDLFIANGHVQDNVSKFDSSTSYAQVMQLFQGTETGTLKDVSKSAGSDLLVPLVGRGAAFGDYDNDGDIDLLVANLEGAPRLLQNQIGSKKNWLVVDCRGSKCNRDAIGARITLHTGSGTRAAEVRRAHSYMSASDPRVHFGLGNLPHVARIEIRWPGGSTESISHSTDRPLRANQIIKIVEGEGKPRTHR